MTPPTFSDQLAFPNAIKLHSILVFLETKYGFGPSFPIFAYNYILSESRLFSESVFHSTLMFDFATKVIKSNILDIVKTRIINPFTYDLGEMSIRQKAYPLIFHDKPSVMSEK